MKRRTDDGRDVQTADAFVRVAVRSQVGLPISADLQLIKDRQNLQMRTYADPSMTTVLFLRATAMLRAS